MHESLFPDLAAAQLAQTLPPPVVAIFDIHMHSGSPAATGQYVRAARDYGATAAVNMTFGGMADAMRGHFGDFFTPCGWPRWIKQEGSPPDWDWFNREWVDGLPSKLRGGMRFIKTKLVPHVDAPPALELDDPRLAPMFSRCEESESARADPRRPAHPLVGQVAVRIYLRA